METILSDITNTRAEFYRDPRSRPVTGRRLGALIHAAELHRNTAPPAPAPDTLAGISTIGDAIRFFEARAAS